MVDFLFVTFKLMISIHQTAPLFKLIRNSINTFINIIEVVMIIILITNGVFSYNAVSALISNLLGVIIGII